MRRQRVWCLRIVERTIRVGFWFKGASEFEENRPQFSGFFPTLLRGKGIPVQPLGRDSVVVVHEET
jgi:hypothetical protein